MEPAVKSVSPGKPDTGEFDPYYSRYIDQVHDLGLFETLRAQSGELSALIGSLPEEKGMYAYDEGKWTIKEMLSHILDGERIFMYRALRIARGDQTPIEGFEQDVYIEHSHANERSFAELTEEFRLLRESALLLLSSLDADDWKRTGTANGVSISVRALGYIMAGHVIHHLKVLRERYLG